MTEAPVLLFLHGVGNGDPGDAWKAELGSALADLGYPDLDAVTIIAPKFAHALKGSDETAPLPPLTVAQPTRDAAKQNRRAFERRMGAVEFRLGRHEKGQGYLFGDKLVDLSLQQSQFVQAHNYLNVPSIRSEVLTRILGRVPTSGQIVLVGHSLGSVIAADLVRRLPTDLHVAGMVTIGSPLASVSFDVDALRTTLKEPPTNLEWWVNFWNWHDPVSARRGVSAAFPWMVDFRIQTALSPHVHDAVEYLAEPAVADAIGFGLFGSRSREVARVESSLEVPPNRMEHLALLALRYANLTEQKLDGDTRERYAGARRHVQATVIDGLRAQAALDGRPAPSTVTQLAFDFSDSRSPLPEPRPAGHLSKEEAVVPLTVLAAENIIRPFDIDVPRAKQTDAMADLTAEMGLGSQLGRDVFAAAGKAREVVNDKTGINWVKWGVLGAGAAALVVATGGLAVAFAAPGLAGAAVVTSALATFGPGGMVGGLITAGTLVTAGGGGVAYGLASPGTTAETVETVVERQLAAAILRKTLGLGQDPAVWRNIVETEIEIRRQIERVDEFSDASSVTLKELRRKLVATERALAYLHKEGLVPEGQKRSSPRSSPGAL